MSFSELKKGLSRAPHLDVSRIERAYKLAYQAHEGQKRKTGEPFITHPLKVAKIILELSGTEDMICAALLHDSIEDSDDLTMADRISKEYGSDVLFMVEALSKNPNIADKEQQQENYFDQIQEALHMDVAIFFLKMADLIHNMETIGTLSPSSKTLWIHELQDLYMPLLSDAFPVIPLPFHGMYHNLMAILERLIDTHNAEPVPIS